MLQRLMPWTRFAAIHPAIEDTKMTVVHFLYHSKYIFGVQLCVIWQKLCKSKNQANKQKTVPERVLQPYDQATPTQKTSASRITPESGKYLVKNTTTTSREKNMCLLPLTTSPHDQVLLRSLFQGHVWRTYEHML